MRRPFFSRLLTAMFGLWFTFTLIQPTGMIGMTMSGGSASMMAGMSMSGTPMNGTSTADISMMDMSGMEMSGMDMSPHDMSRSSTHAEKVANAGQGAPAQSNAPQECDQHDCCCSAVPLTMLAPNATLSWLPEHVINQDTPRTGDCVVHTDGQVRLPFANGPPAAVIA